MKEDINKLFDINEIFDSLQELIDDEYFIRVSYLLIYEDIPTCVYSKSSNGGEIISIDNYKYFLNIYKQNKDVKLYKQCRINIINTSNKLILKSVIEEKVNWCIKRLCEYTYRNSTDIVTPLKGASRSYYGDCLVESNKIPLCCNIGLLSDNVCFNLVNNSVCSKYDSVLN